MLRLVPAMTKILGWIKGQPPCAKEGCTAPVYTFLEGESHLLYIIFLLFAFFPISLHFSFSFLHFSHFSYFVLVFSLCICVALIKKIFFKVHVVGEGTV